MLNEGLYETLRTVFGKVVLENRNQKATISASARTAVSSKLGRQDAKVINYGEQLRVNCPFCHYTQPGTKQDTGQHLWISYIYDSDIQMDGQIYNFGWNPARCYRRDCMDDTSNRRELYAMIKKAARGENFTVGEATESTVDPSNPPKVDFPPYIHLTDKDVPKWVHDYIEGRGHTARELEDEWGAVLGSVPFYKLPSLVFPIYQRDQYVSWQARYIGEKMERWPDGNEKPKYFIPAATKKSWMLYNIDRAKFTSPGVLVEGIFDCMKVGPNGIASLGRKISEYQFKLLGSYFRTGRLIWLPDMNDPLAAPYADRTAQWMMDNGIVKDVKVVRLPSDDPGKFSKEEIWSLINRINK